MRLPWPLRPLFFVQDFLGGLYAAIGMLFYWIMPYSHSHSLSVLWAFLGGLYVAIGMLFYWIMPYSHSHSLSVLWAFLGGLYAAIGMLFYWIMPYSHSHSLSVLWAFMGGLYAAIGMLFYWIMPYSNSHIPTPTLLWLGLLLPLSSRHLIHLPIPHRQVCQCFAHIKCLGHQHMTLAWFALSPLHHLFAHPPPTGFFYISWLAGCMGYT